MLYSIVDGRRNQRAWIYMQFQRGQAFQRETEAMQRKVAASNTKGSFVFSLFNFGECHHLEQHEGFTCAAALIWKIFRGTNRQRVDQSGGVVWGPICHADQSHQALDKRLAPWDSRRQTGQWGGSEEAAYRSTAGWRTSVTPCFRFPWRRDTPRAHPVRSSGPPRCRAAHTHHALTAW